MRLRMVWVFSALVRRPIRLSVGFWRLLFVCFIFQVRTNAGPRMLEKFFCGGVVAVGWTYCNWSIKYIVAYKEIMRKKIIIYLLTWAVIYLRWFFRETQQWNNIDEWKTKDQVGSSLYSSQSDSKDQMNCCPPNMVGNGLFKKKRSKTNTFSPGTLGCA